LARKILLADDSVTAQNMGRRILTDAGYEVITVNNGSAALKKATDQRPDLIVLDVYMPGYGGLEVCQRLKESSETARIPVLLTVGKLEPFKPDEARRARADAFIVKPFEASELLAALTKLEDRIVPQAAPSKPSRSKASFGQSLSADGREQFGDLDTGWKNRLSVPPPHAKRHEAEPAEVPETDSRPQAGSVASKEQPAKAVSEPSALPPDITADEIAAIAAAAEAVRMKTAPETPAEPPASAPSTPAEFPVSAPVAEPEPSLAQEAKTGEPPPLETAPPRAEIAAEAKAPEAPAVPEVAASSKLAESEVTAALASLEPANGNGSAIKTSEEIPATVAAAVAQASMVASNAPRGPRWMAHEIPVEGNDARFILEQEMQKAYAAMAAAEGARMQMSAAASALAPSATESGFPSAVTVVEPPSVAVADLPEPLAASEAKGSEPAVASAEPAAVEETKATEAVAEIAVTPETSAAVEPPKEAEVPAAKEEIALAAAASVSTTAPAEAAPSPAESTPAPSEAATPAAEESDFQGTAEQAAAWEHWQKVRESVMESHLTEPITEAATAGLKDLEKEASVKGEGEEAAAVPSTNPNAIASIVDSVLAELKPKLVQEIAKQLGNEKKKKE